MTTIKEQFRKIIERVLLWALQDVIKGLKDEDRVLNSKIDDHYRSLSHRNDKLYRILQMLSLAKVGVDHHIKQSSWAVVCTRDKKGKERVNFYSICDDGVAELRDLLKSSEKDDVIVDTHPEFNHFFNW